MIWWAIIPGYMIFHFLCGLGAARMCYLNLDSEYPFQEGKLDEFDISFIKAAFWLGPFSLIWTSTRHLFCYSKFGFNIVDFVTRKPTPRMCEQARIETLEKEALELKDIIKELEETVNK